ncbi:hypothetical protein [Adhaeribacter aquaticus]|uniref:hypothetical protein n=1 Tax=Adhaeribacter aquaticus TaxID=299567 RepID=UPI00047A57D3|nr:hypothetical protein [Adhaeribacter aquaticus]
MFAGISWGQFGLFVLVGVIIYYTIIILMYYRTELFSKFSRSSTPPDLVPTSASTPVFSAVGSTPDYGNSSAPSLIPVVNAFTAGPVVGAVADSETDTEINESENPFDEDEIPVTEDQAAVAETAESGSALAEIQDHDFFQEDDINLEEQFIAFEPDVEVPEGGIAVDDLHRTVALLHQEDINPVEQTELAGNLEILNDTLLLQTVMSNNSRARSRVDLLLGQNLEKRDNDTNPPVIADSFADLDVKKLINSI